MTKDKYFNFFKNAKTKEELLLIYWKVIKYKNEFEKYEILETFKRAYNMLDKIEIKELNVIDNLLLTYSKGNDIYSKALEICEENDLIIDNINEIIDEEISKDKNSSQYKIILNKINYLLNKGIILSKTLKEQNIDYSIAKKTIKIYIASSIDNIKNFVKLTSCSRKWLYTATEILEVKKHPLYYEFLKMKEEKYLAKREISDKEKYYKIDQKLTEKVTNLSEEDIIQLFNRKNKKELKKFCLLNNINITLITTLTIVEPNFLNEFIKDFSIYFVYEEQYKNIIRKVIEEIKEANSPKSKDGFDLYKYYLKTSLSLERLSSIALTFNDIEDKTIIRKYIEKNGNLLEIIDERRLKSLSQTNHITNGNDTILFTKNEIKKAINDINAQNMPLNKGTIYGAIKHQKELVKKKYSLNKY